MMLIELNVLKRCKQNLTVYCQMHTSVSVDKVVAKLSGCSLFTKRSIWTHIHLVDVNVNYFEIHLNTYEIYVENIFRFLLNEWKPSKTNNKSMTYRLLLEMGFFLFNTDYADFTRQRCDSYVY
jgi:hypothetical protein